MTGSKIIVKGTGVALVAASVLLVGCSGGPLSTREKGAGIGALGARRQEDSSARQWADREPVRRSAAPWV